MLTGLMNFTKGSANVLGFDVETQISEVRKSMGVCPQFDILFDDLTVEEHLTLFATFKGMEADQIEPEVKKMISDLNLREKTNQLAKTLSGGQKRRLSTGIAFIGNSKFIVLDEPTSGMDPTARRQVWEMLKNYKNNRIILLTTHFMDEADYLGDRIGIMSEGKLKCLGSSIYLKNQFGVGYNLTLVRKQGAKNESLEQTIKSILPGAIMLQDVSQELSFQLPNNEIANFQKLFDTLDRDGESLKIDSYGVSITTLEEVFLKTTELDHGNQAEAKEEIENNLDQEVDNYDYYSNRMRNSLDVFKSHFKALLWKRINYLRKDKKGIVAEIFLPILIVIFGFGISTIQFIVN